MSRLNNICFIYGYLNVSRCADLMSGVTRVLQSVGVRCCTVQPEFTSGSGSSAGSGEASPVIHREDPSLPPTPACNLACGKACTGSMCCSLLEEENRSMLAPPTGETGEDSQTLVIENTILWPSVLTKELLKKLQQKKNNIWYPCTDVKVKIMDVICLKSLPAHYM